MQPHSFGYWLKRKRKALDLTQAELASQVGCSAAAIRKIEADERRPSTQITGRLAEVFNIPQNEQATFLRFARGDWTLTPSESIEDFPWRASTAFPRSNLPTPPTALIGREQEVAIVREYLSKDDIRLVTLIGPPGIGKTRLSIEAARVELPNFSDGVFFVALAPLEDPNLLAPTIVQTLGFAEKESKSPIERLKEGIGEKHMLLVLDNLEHLIEGVAPLVAELMISCPRLKILTTSREALRVSGEWLYPVPALNIPEKTQLQSIDMDGISQNAALALFVERARAVRPDFALNADNIQAVATICSQLDGLPLAIELIAARIRLMSPESLLARLNDQFTLYTEYTDGMRAQPTRQKTLHDAIAWSYNLLSTEEQGLFARLSVFSAGFTLEAAESIFSWTTTGKSISDIIASLLDKSLLQRAYDTQGELRFNMLVTIQHFALDRLPSMGEKSDVRNWHLVYFLDLAEQADKEIHGPNQLAWMDRLEKDHDNFRVALEWCVSNKKTELALRLLGALSWLWHVQGQDSELRSWFNKIRTLPEISAHPARYARLLNQIGQSNWLSGDFLYARSILEESQAIWLKLGVEGESGLAETLDYLGMVARAREGDNKTAQSFFKRSFELYQKHGDQWGMAFVSFNLGIVASERNDDVLALSLLEQSLDLFRQLGDLWGIGRVSQLLGQLFLKQGNYEKARLLFEQHLRIDESLHFKQGTMVALGNLGTLYRYQGDYEKAEQFLEKSLAISHAYGLNDWGVGSYSLGLIALHRNDYLLARQRLIDNFGLEWKTFDEKISASDLLIGSASIAAGTKQPERAAKLFGALQAILEMTDYHFSPLDYAELDRHIQIARNQLGDVKFEALAAEGRAMTMEQAIAYALKNQSD